MNPILPGDFSDLDAIRVGHDYYAISSTMQFSPGMVILHSYDLVNWTMIGHVVQDLTAIDPELNWNRMDRPGRGIWAGAIRYHDRKFWVYFGTPDQGIFMSMATVPTGPWSPPKLVLHAPGWDDPCPFWDDNRRLYLVVTHFAPEQHSGKTYTIHLFRLSISGDKLSPESDRIIHESPGSEANKLYKINGTYYHFYSQVSHEGRVPMMERARNLGGTWKSRQLMHVNASVDKEPNQGAFIETPSGKWYFLTHQGHGDWEGRAGILLPVTWVDGWPVPGKIGADGIGSMMWSAQKPITGFPRTLLTNSSRFSGSLRPEWEWNYQPSPAMWSLTARPGHLRLYAFPPIRPSGFDTIGNVISQRSFRTEQNSATVKLTLTGMADDERAGLAHFAKTYCVLGVEQQDGVRRIYYQRNDRSSIGPVVRGSSILLRSTWDYDGKSQFFYSIDGRTYRAFGDPYHLTWGNYRGDRVGIFTFNSISATGYVDVDTFDYQVFR